MDNILSILFESVAKVRMLRLFMQNPDRSFTLPEIRQLTQISGRSLTRDLNKLVKVGLVKEKMGIVHEEKKEIRSPMNKKKSGKQKGKKMILYTVHTEFPVFDELYALIIKSSTASRKKLLSYIKRLGKIKLVVLSGIFLNDDMSRLDLMIVGDDIKKRSLEKFLVMTESELGKMLRYSVMDTEEFRYRMNMYDRFLRDLLERNHEKLINKLNV
ncbi:MAG: hypothetical protein Q8R40_06875 [bacterium]|nr:hypothetical protein [bacterium]